MGRGVFEQTNVSSSGADALRQQSRRNTVASIKAVAAIALAGGACYGANKAYDGLRATFPDRPPIVEPQHDDYPESYSPELDAFRDQLNTLDQVGFNVTPEQAQLVPEARYSADQAQQHIMELLTLGSDNGAQIDPHPAFPDINKPQPVPSDKEHLLDTLNKNIIFKALQNRQPPTFHNPNRNPASTFDEWINGGNGWEYVLPEIIGETEYGYIIGFNTVPLNVRMGGELVTELNAVTHPFFLVRIDFNPTIGEPTVTVIQDRGFDPNTQLNWQNDLLARRQAQLDCSHVACVTRALPARPERDAKEQFDPNSPDADFDKWWHPDSPLIKGDILSTPKAEYTADKAANDIMFLLTIKNNPEFADSDEFLPQPTEPDEISAVLAHNNRAYARHMAAEGQDIWSLFHDPAQPDRRGNMAAQNSDKYVRPYEFAGLSNNGKKTGKILGYSYRAIDGGVDHSDVRNPTFMFRVEIANGGHLEVTAIQKRFNPDDEVSWEYYGFLRYPQTELYTGHIVTTQWKDIVDKLDRGEREQLELEWGKPRLEGQSMKIDPKDEIDKFKRKAARKAQILRDRRGPKTVFRARR